MDEETRALFAQVSKNVTDVGRMIASKRIETQFDSKDYDGINDLIGALRLSANTLEIQTGTVQLRNK